MKLLSVITVVKDDLNSLKSTCASLERLKCPHEWIVVDGGKDFETIEWMQFKKEHFANYLREPDKNLYDAMNKGIHMSVGSHAIFVNAGDEISESNQINGMLDDLGEDEGFIGCIRRKEKGGGYTEVIIKPSRFAAWLIEYGIKPTSHQATIYPLRFLKEYPYDVNVGLVADQLSIMNLLKHREVRINSSEVICDFKNGGLGDRQPKGAFFKQMFVYRCAHASYFKLVSEVIMAFPILIIKITFSILGKFRFLRIK
jgi:glycosyltransferase involved in cell wall biosynthesis